MVDSRIVAEWVGKAEEDYLFTEKLIGKEDAILIRGCACRFCRSRKNTGVYKNEAFAIKAPATGSFFDLTRAPFDGAGLTEDGVSDTIGQV